MSEAQAKNGAETGLFAAPADFSEEAKKRRSEAKSEGEKPVSKAAMRAFHRDALLASLVCAFKKTLD